MLKTKKKQIVQNLVDQFQKNKDYLLLTYNQLPTNLINDLKKKLKLTKTKLIMVKNSLLEKAFNYQIKNPNFKLAKKQFFPLKKPTALVFFQETSLWIEGLKILYQFLEDQKKIQFRFGFLENNFYDEKQLINLSKLPNRKQLFSQLIGSLNNPTRKLIYLTKNPIEKLIYILKNRKGGESNG